MSFPTSAISKTPSSVAGQVLTHLNKSQQIANQVNQFVEGENRPQSFSASILGPSVPLALKARVAQTPPRKSHLFAKTGNWIPRKGHFGSLETALLAKHLSKEDELVVRVLHGRGGMGKSELALRFAHEHTKKFSFVWCFDYSPTADLLAQYQKLAKEMGLSSNGEENLEELRESVNSALANWTGTPWLLLLDKIETKIHPDLLPTKGGRILMTTQNSEVWDCQKEVLLVDTFTLEEAVALIKDVTGETAFEEIEALANDWGLFPFAIHQVSRYIQETQMTIAEYRKNYPDPLEGAISQQEKYQKAFNTVWNPALEKVKALCSPALEWLEMIGFLAARDIPETILIDWLTEKSGAPNPEEVRRYLLRFALATFNKEQKTYDLHRLFQAVLRERGEKKDKLNTLFSILKKIWEFNQNKSETWSPARSLLPHLRVWAEHASKLDPDEGLSFILVEIGDYVRVLDGNYKEAIDFYKRTKKILETIEWPKNSLEYMRALMSLGLAYHEMDQRDEAKEAYKEVEGLLPELNEDDCSTILPPLMQNLGEFYHDIGRLDLAILYHQQAVAYSIINGSEIQKVRSLNNLGHCLLETGEIGAARTFLEEALDLVDEMEASESNPLLPNLKMGMAAVYFKENEKEDGIKAAEEALKAEMELSHPEHPEVAKLRALYSQLLTEYGDLEGALKQLDETEKIFKTVYGEECEKLVQLNITRGEIFRRGKKFDEARNELDKALKNPHVDFRERISIFNNLGSIESDLAPEAHDPKAHLMKAREHYLSAIKELPEGHNNQYIIVDQLVNFGDACTCLGEPEVGIPSLKRALDILSSIDSNENLETLSRVYRYLVVALIDTKKFDEAIDTLGKIIKILEDQSSDQNLRELTLAYQNLGVSYFEKGEKEQGTQKIEAKSAAEEAWKRGLATADTIRDLAIRTSHRNELARQLMKFSNVSFRDLTFPFTLP